MVTSSEFIWLQTSAIIYSNYKQVKVLQIRNVYRTNFRLDIHLCRANSYRSFFPRMVISLDFEYFDPYISDPLSFHNLISKVHLYNPSVA